jgi:pimeloyl-ACP methyl ester carboxylesterase
MAELVFIHGAGDSAAVWERQVRHFGSHHRVLAIDLPGHGRRLSEEALKSHDDNAEEAGRQMRAGGFGSPVVVGHSMGGAVALSQALRRPSVPRALVLVASGARLRMAPDLIEAARQRAESAPAGQAVGASIPLDRAVSSHASGQARAWLSERVGQSTAQATYADFLANDGFDVMGRLGEIDQPVLVLAGQDDELTPPKFQTFLAERMPHARLVLLPKAGHYVQVELEAAVNHELEGFLAELDGRP